MKEIWWHSGVAHLLNRKMIWKPSTGPLTIVNEKSQQNWSFLTVLKHRRSVLYPNQQLISGLIIRLKRLMTTKKARSAQVSTLQPTNSTTTEWATISSNLQSTKRTPPLLSSSSTSLIWENSSTKEGSRRRRFKSTSKDLLRRSTP